MQAQALLQQVIKKFPVNIPLRFSLTNKMAAVTDYVLSVF